MKKIILSALLALSTIGLYSQVIVDDININELEDVYHCQLVARGRLFSNKVTITIDYGQFIKWSKGKGSIIKGQDGKAKKFNSVMDAINFMAKNGWKYEDAYVVTIDAGMGGNQNVYHYTFTKK